MKTDLFQGRAIIFISIIVICCKLGFEVRHNYETETLIWPWLVISLLSLVLMPLLSKVTINKQWFKFENYCLLLIAAVSLNISVFFFGNEHQGAYRFFGDDEFRVRVSLWSLVLVTLFFSVFITETSSSRPKPLLWLSVLLAFYLFQLLRQPDLYVACILIVLLIAFSSVAKARVIRTYILSSSLLVLAVVISSILSVPYYSTRVLSIFDNPRSYGSGFSSLYSQDIMSQAGWWGGGDNTLLTAPNFEQQIFYLLSHLKGNLTVGLVIVLMLLFTHQLYVAANTMTERHQKVVFPLLAIWSINHILAVCGAFNIFPLMGHFGVAFVSLSDMTLYGVILAYLAIRWGNNDAK